LTVRVASGEARRWTDLKSVYVVASPGTEGVATNVKESRGYSDRLVLKLEGIDDPGAANALKGFWVLAPPDQIPVLPEGVHYSAWLVGMAVRDEKGRDLGRVVDVTGTAGSDLLVVEEPDGHELLIPVVPEIVLEVRQDREEIEVRLPDGLLELNRRSRH